MRGQRQRSHIVLAEHLSASQLCFAVRRQRQGSHVVFAVSGRTAKKVSQPFGEGLPAVWGRSPYYLGKVQFQGLDRPHSLWHPGLWEAFLLGKVPPPFSDRPRLHLIPSPFDPTVFTICTLYLPHLGTSPSSEIADLTQSILICHSLDLRQG